LVGIAMWVMPSAFAIDTAITRPRALNEPVGRRPSSLTMISPPPSFLASRGREMSGVASSPRLTMSWALRTGSSSRHFHSPSGRAFSASLVSAFLTPSRS
jgi:hypothetical protein